MAAPAFSFVMSPSLRPTIIVPFDETGDRINCYLMRLTPSLDPVITRAIAIVRYQGDHGVASERRSTVPGDTESEDGTGPHGGQRSFASADAPWAVRDIGIFSDLMLRAISDIQDVRTLDRLQRAGYKTPDSLAQIIVVGRADSPVLRDTLYASRDALAAAARTLGANLSLDAPILCVLADHGSSTDSRPFTEHVRSTAYDWDDWAEAPAHVSELRENYLAQADLSGVETDEDVVDPAESWRQRQQRIAVKAALLSRQTTLRRPSSQTPATFQFLYSRVLQGRRATLSEDLVNYIMAEAVYGLAATGASIAPSMEEIMRATHGVSATKDRVGSLGACLVRFPRGEAEAYCIASLGAELLEYWGQRESAIRRGSASGREEEMQDAAHAFVVDLLTPWIAGDLLRDWPEPEFDGWPDPDNLSEETRKAQQSLQNSSLDLEDLISADEIYRLLDSRDPNGEARRSPERFGALWKDITETQWYDFDEIRRAQWNAAAGNAYRTVSDELNTFLDRKVDDIWLDPNLGWQAASAYVSEMSDDLYKTTLNRFADDRIADAAEYESRLRDYEGMIREAYADIPGGGSLEETADTQPYEPSYRNDPASFVHRPGGADIHAPGYNPPNADPLMNGVQEDNTAPEATAQGVSISSGVTPGTVSDEDTYVSGAPADPTDPSAANAGGTSADDPGTQPAEVPVEGGATREPPTREEREDVVIRGMADLVVKRQLDRRMFAPALGLSLIAAPELTLITQSLLDMRWPLSTSLVASSVGIVVAGLGALMAALWFWVRRRADEALDEHLNCLAIIGDRRRKDVEERLRVFVIKQAQTNVQEMRDHLENWPGRINTIAEELRGQAQAVSKELFDGPAGYHDILIAYGERLLAPELPIEDRGLQDGDEDTPAETSPLHRIYQRFSDERARNPVEPWHSSLDGILDQLRASFRIGQGGIVRMSDAAFRALVRRFLYGRFRVYLRSEMGRLNQALDPRGNPGAIRLWQESREHAEPPQGAPGAEILYITGQSETLAVSATLGDERTTQRIVTRDVMRHKEWLQIMRLRRGGIPL